MSNVQCASDNAEFGMRNAELKKISNLQCAMEGQNEQTG